MKGDEGFESLDFGGGSPVQQSIFRGLMPFVLARSRASMMPYPPFRISTIRSCHLGPQICSLYGEGNCPRMSRKITAVVMRMLALRNAGSQSCRERVVEGEVAKYCSCWKALRSVMRTVRTCDKTSARGVVERMPVVFGGAITHL